MRCDRVRGGRPARADWAEQDAGSQDKAGHAGGGRPGAGQDVMGFSLDTCEFAVLVGHPWRHLVGTEIRVPLEGRRGRGR